MADNPYPGRTLFRPSSSVRSHTNTFSEGDQPDHHHRTRPTRPAVIGNPAGYAPQRSIDHGSSSESSAAAALQPHPNDIFAAGVPSDYASRFKPGVQHALPSDTSGRQSRTLFQPSSRPLLPPEAPPSNLELDDPIDARQPAQGGPRSVPLHEFVAEVVADAEQQVPQQAPPPTISEPPGASRVKQEAFSTPIRAFNAGSGNADGEMAKLDAYQRRCVTSPINGSLLIHAGAGSGKTRTMVCRIVHMIDQGVPARNILGLAFTRASAQTLRDRVGGELGDSRRHMASEVRLCTLHSWCLSFLRRHREPREFRRDDTGLAPFSVATTKTMREVCEAVVEQHARHRKDRGYVNDLLYLMQYMREQPEYNPHKKLDAGSLAEEGELNRLYDIAQKMLFEDRTAMDFVDLMWFARRVLRENDFLRGEMQALHTHIVVDEFQDLNAVQLDIVELLAGTTPKLMCVGDPNQAIYGWRGAVPHIFEEVRRRYPEMPEPVTLLYNYRSTRNIITAASAVPSGGAVQEAVKVDDAPVELMGIIETREDVEAARMMSQKITKLLWNYFEDQQYQQRRASGRHVPQPPPRADAGPRVSPDQIAVLARTRNMAKIAAHELELADLSVSRSAPRGADELRLSKVLMACAQLALDEESNAEENVETVLCQNPCVKGFSTSFRQGLRDLSSLHRKNHFAVLRQLVDENFVSLKDRDAPLKLRGDLRVVVTHFVRNIAAARTMLMCQDGATPVQTAKAALQTLATAAHLVNEDGTSAAFIKKFQEHPPGGDSSAAPTGGGAAVDREQNFMHDDADGLGGGTAEENGANVLSLLQRACDAAAPPDGSLGTLPADVLLASIDEIRTLVNGDTCTMQLGGNATMAHGNPSQPQASITVTTVHQAKGLEWPIVFVFGCMEGLLPMRRNRQEELRIAYVAFSRAMEQLYVVAWQRTDNSTSSGEKDHDYPAEFLKSRIPSSVWSKESIEQVKRIEYEEQNE